MTSASETAAMSKDDVLTDSELDTVSAPPSTYRV
jgi:hypothetical protein